MSLAREYYDGLVAALEAGPPAELEDAAALLHEAVLAGAAIYTFGNGACAALASHMATDLGKALSPRVRVVSLVDNSALMTAYANDQDYECVFAEPLCGLLRAGDVALGISASGSSANVLAALEYARGADGRTIGLTGDMDGWKRMSERCDVVVRAPLQRIEQIEDLHVVFSHILLRLLRARLRDG